MRSAAARKRSGWDVPPVNAQWFSHEVIRIHPTRVLSWHIDPEHPDGQSRDVH